MKGVRLRYVVTSCALVLAFSVAMLGAYTRLQNAGLGCPDWPGCYGQWVAPAGASKAWIEMTHRYAAGSLGLLILFLFFLSVRAGRIRNAAIPLLLVGLVIFQAALGMWTVTLKLFPLVVMGHLLGGMTIFALLWVAFLQQQRDSVDTLARRMRPWAMVALIIVVTQIALGGWVSSNYAALICPTFPSCQGYLWPPTDFKTAFNVFSPLGVNYQGGILGNTARVTIQLMHRIGASVVASYLAGLGIYLLYQKQSKRLRILACVMLFLLCLQVSLGILNIKWLLPLPIAVAHNGVAALLLISVVSLVFYTSRRYE